VIGIFGGTFDPIHNGHLHVIKQLLLSNRVESIIVVPAGEPLLRESPIASGLDRLAMCSAALETLGDLGTRVEVSSIEVEKEGPSYAIETAVALIQSHPEKEMAWIIGSDAYQRIDQWHESERLQDLISFIVIERPQSEEDDFFDEVDPLEIDALDISATEIRSLLATRKAVSHLIPAPVLRYIESKGLYGGA
jgi:nicotinate-nucleotide adenylyltransferase